MAKAGWGTGDYMDKWFQKEETKLKQSTGIIESGVAQFWFDKINKYSFPKGKILDVGCGVGTYAEQFHSRNSKCNYVGIDYSPTAIKIAKERYPFATFKVMDAYTLKFKSNSFDLVFCNHVISFLYNERKTISEMDRVLKPKGVLILTGNIKPQEWEAIYGKVGDPVCFYIARLEDYGFEVKQIIFGMNFLNEWFRKALPLLAKTRKIGAVQGHLSKTRGQQAGKVLKISKILDTFPFGYKWFALVAVKK